MEDSDKIKLNEAERKNRMFEGLFEANAAVTSSLDRDEVLNIVLDKAREILKCSAGSIFLIDETTDELVLEASTNLSPEEGRKIRFPRGLGIAGWVAEHGEAVVLEDISNDPRFYSGVQEKTGFHTTSYLCVPLKVNEKIIGTAQVLNRRDGGPFSDYDLHFMEGFARQAAIALENARLHQEELEKKRIEEELSLAYQIQKNLLPKTNPRLPDYDIAGLSYPSRWVGGDYYDFIKLPEGKLGVAVADVCGKGIPAAVMMSSVQAVLNALSTQNLPLAEIVTHLNRYLCRHSATDRFVTFFYGILNFPDNSFTYINGGHNPPHVFRKGGEVEKLLEGGLILGVMEDEFYDTGKVMLENGDLLLMFTDGVTEVHNEEREMYGEERLIGLVNAMLELPSEEIIQNTNREITKFARSGQLEDDFTMVCVKRNQ